MLTIRRDWPRVEPAAIARFLGTPTGWLVDAMGREGALHHTIHAIWNGPAFVGSALPVWTSARDNLAPYAALTVARPGDVVLVATQSFDQGSIVGDVMVGMFRNAGVVAVVTDGLVRDVAGLRDVGLPVYACGVSPNSPFKHGPGGVGMAISIGGVVVEPGDVVLGDAEGVVVCPRRRVPEALRELDAVRAKEAKMEAAVKAGLRVPDWLDQALAGKDVRYVD
jgi:4-hydroxy-4-methyl-2-oxoglutarate aldolase